jgi:hypothetical protein
VQPRRKARVIVGKEKHGNPRMGKTVLEEITLACEGEAGILRVEGDLPF